MCPKTDPNLLQDSPQDSPKSSRQSLRIETLEREIELLRSELRELSTAVRMLTGVDDSGKIDASVGPVKLAGSGKWLVALVLAFALAALATGGKALSWIAKSVAP
jgi:hypothetical protein